MEEAYKDLYKTVWVTRVARFIASERNKKLQRISSLGISILSFYIISLGIYTYYSSSEIVSSMLTFITLCLSVFILILSVHEGSKQFELKAHLFHVCGKELSSVYNSLKYGIMLKNFEQKEFNELLSKYENIIQQYDENHAEVDNKIFRAKNWNNFYCSSYDSNTQPLFFGAERFMESLKSLLKTLWYYISIFWFYLLVIFGPPLILILYWVFKPHPQIF